MRIAHAIEQYDDEDSGFIHALGIAAAHSGGAELLTLHITNRTGSESGAPRAAVWLERWQSGLGDIAQRVLEYDGHEGIDDELIGAFRSLRPDLVILPTRVRTGLSRLLIGSIAEAVARNLDIPCLLVPDGSAPFVDRATGALDLKRVLVLGGSQPDAELGIDTAAWLLRALGQTRAELTLLHVENRRGLEEVHHPAGVRLRIDRRRGQLIQAASMAIAEQEPRLVVSVSHGHDDISDVFWSSRTEQVLRVVRQPLLWIPASYRVPVPVLASPLGHTHQEAQRGQRER